MPKSAAAILTVGDVLDAFILCQHHQELRLLFNRTSLQRKGHVIVRSVQVEMVSETAMASAAW